MHGNNCCDTSPGDFEAAGDLRSTRSTTSSAKLGRRVLLVTVVTALCVAIISPSRRFGVGVDDPVEPVGLGQELGPGEPILAVVLYPEGYGHVAWAAATSIHAAEPRMKIQSVRLPPEHCDTGFDCVSIAAVETMRRVLAQHEGKTIMMVTLHVGSMVTFYRPFAEAFSTVNRKDHSTAHSFVHCADGVMTGVVSIVRSSQQSQRFWGRVRRTIIDGHSHRWKNVSLSAAIGAVVTTQLFSGANKGGDPRLGSVTCLPTTVLATASKQVIVQAENPPEGCVVPAHHVPDVPQSYASPRYRALFITVETECGSLPWSQETPLRDLRQRQHLRRSVFSTVDATPILKGNVIAVQLPHTTEMPLSRWATTLSLRAAEPSFRQYLVDPKGETGRDPTPPASRIAEIVDAWARVSPADSTFVWVSGPAVAFSPFVDLLSLTLHHDAPALVIGTCGNVQVVVAKNDPPGAAAEWLRNCADDKLGDHSAVYVLGNPLNGTDDDDRGAAPQVPVDVKPVTLHRDPTDDTRLCVLDDARYVRALIHRSSPGLATAAQSADEEAFVASVALRCGSGHARRLLLGHWTDSTTLEASIVGPQSALARVAAATRAFGILPASGGTNASAKASPEVV